MPPARLAAAALLIVLCACGRDGAARPAEDAVLRPDTAVAEIPPPPPPPVCAVMLSPGEARVFGVCSAAELAAAIAAPAASDPRAPACAVRVGGGAPVYEGCVDLSAAGLKLLEDAAADYSPPEPEPSPAAPPPSAEQP